MGSLAWETHRNYGRAATPFLRQQASFTQLLLDTLHIGPVLVDLHSMHSLLLRLSAAASHTFNGPQLKDNAKCTK